jgi:hypothetical protein
VLLISILGSLLDSTSAFSSPAPLFSDWLLSPKILLLYLSFSKTVDLLFGILILAELLFS